MSGVVHVCFSVQSEKSELGLNPAEGAATTIWPLQGHSCVRPINRHMKADVQHLNHSLGRAAGFFLFFYSYQRCSTKILLCPVLNLNQANIFSLILCMFKDMKLHEHWACTKPTKNDQFLAQIWVSSTRSWPKHYEVRDAASGRDFNRKKSVKNNLL